MMADFPLKRHRHRQKAGINKRFPPMTGAAYAPGSVWASLDTRAPMERAEPCSWHPPLVLGVILAASYPDFETIAN